jgi:hypothetical protein
LIGTLSPAFVLLLVATAELSFAETMVMAAALGMVLPPLLGLVYVSYRVHVVHQAVARSAQTAA